MDSLGRKEVISIKVDDERIWQYREISGALRYLSGLGRHHLLVSGGYGVMVVRVNVFVCIGGNVEKVRYDDLYFDVSFLQKL